MISQAEAEVLVALKAKNRYSTAQDIADAAGKSRPRTSTILRALANRDILIARKKGTKVLYAVNEKSYLELQNNKKASIVMNSIQPVEQNHPLINLFFGFKEDAITVYNKEKMKKAINTIEDNKEEAILSFMEAITYPSFEAVWEIAPGIHTNYDFDLLALRCEPSILNAIVDCTQKKFGSILNDVDGIVGIRHNRINVRSPACGIYTRNTIPFAVALSLRLGKPLIIADFDMLHGNVEKYGNYLVVDDGPIYGDDLLATVKKIKEIARVRILLILERNDIATKKLERLDVSCHTLFRTKDVIERVFKNTGRLLFYIH